MLENNLLLGAAIYGGIVLVIFWVAMVVWSYRDMRARSRDGLAQLFVAALVGVLNLPGLFIYMMLRPRETLSEAYERSLEEEALLQEIEEKPTCPGCAQRVQTDWQACAYCHTRLKKPCIRCTQLLELAWDLCPYCTTDQTQTRRETVTSNYQYTPQYSEEAPPEIPDKWLASGQNNATSNYPQYIDDE